jgi:3-hydroxyacyl-[acyl-carrier-protein] dehydratase
MRLEYFQLIDTIISLSTADGHVRAQAAVPEESPVFQGHFPSFPLMPGVLLIECMAQASGYLLLSHYRFARMPFLASVRTAKLRRFVEPGQKLDIEARLVHDGSGFAVTSASVVADGHRAADAELTFRAMPFPAAEFQDAMRSHAARLGIAVENT